jgi:guanylate kinase
MSKGRSFIISGPSGVGKSTVLKGLMEKRKNLYFSVSATTRQPRPGEEDGVHYHFLTLDTFREWIAQDEFLEHAEFVGNCYGTPRKYVYEAMDRGQDVILDIEVQGAMQVAEKMPEVVRIFIAPPSWTELERRLTERGTDTPEKIQGRLARAKEEVKLAGTYDYFVINDSVENAVRELNAIMTAEHCKPQDRMEVLGEE